MSDEILKNQSEPELKYKEIPESLSEQDIQYIDDHPGTGTVTIEGKDLPKLLALLPLGKGTMGDVVALLELLNNHNNHPNS